MIKWLSVLLACACVLVPQASAKGPISLCGVGSCVQIGTQETSVRWWGGAYESHVAPVAPAPFFKLRFANGYAPLAYWVPSVGVLRVLSQNGPAIWVQPRPDEIEALNQAAASLRAFAAPKRVTVAVDAELVRRGAATYFRLFTMGTPVGRATGAKGWLPIDLRGGETPWTDAYSWMWISKAGGFLKHPDGDVRKISLRLAQRVRNRLPLPSVPKATSRSTAAAETCVGARVRFDEAPDAALGLRTPWISAGRRGRQVVGYLFYYGPDLRTSDRLKIYIGGQLPDGRTSTKILWIPRQAQTSLLTIIGDRLDGTGHFEQEQRVARAGARPVFPSIVDVPRVGCWRLTIRNGRQVVRFAVVAIAP
jgi:hypothetical protein